MAKNNEELAVSKYSKEQIIESKKFKSRVDVLKVILDENKTYTIAEVENEINKFMKGKVN